MHLTKKRRLLLYSNTLEIYNKDSQRGFGLCWHMSRELVKIKPSLNNEEWAYNKYVILLVILPEWNKIYHEETKVRRNSIFLWPLRDKEPRVKALKKMIKEVKLLIRKDNLKKKKKGVKL